MAEEKKGRAVATSTAAKIPKFVRGNLSATLKAKEEGKKVAAAFIADGQDEIMRAMDIVPAWGESFSGVCAAKRDAEKYLQKAESDNFSRSLCTYATCNIGFDMMREELGGALQVQGGAQKAHNRAVSRNRPQDGARARRGCS